MTDFYVRCACGHPERVLHDPRTEPPVRQCSDCRERARALFALEQDALRREYLDRHRTTSGPGSARAEGER